MKVSWVSLVMMRPLENAREDAPALGTSPTPLKKKSQLGRLTTIFFFTFITTTFVHCEGTRTDLVCGFGFFFPIKIVKRFPKLYIALVAGLSHLQDPTFGPLPPLGCPELRSWPVPSPTNT